MMPASCSGYEIADRCSVLVLSFHLRKSLAPMTLLYLLKYLHNRHGIGLRFDLILLFGIASSVTFRLSAFLDLEHRVSTENYHFFNDSVTTYFLRVLYFTSQLIPPTPLERLFVILIVYYIRMSTACK